MNTSNYRVLVLGGYGNAGMEIARQLLRERRVFITLGGRREDEARRAAAALEREAGRSVFAQQVDVANSASLRAALGAVDAVVVASSTAHQTPALVSAVVERGCDYFDLWYSPRQAKWFLAERQRLEQAKLFMLTQAGVHPGLPGVLGRSLLATFDTPLELHVESALRADWDQRTLSTSTAAEMDEPALPLHFVNGAWREVREERETAFDATLTQQWLQPIYLPECGQLLDSHPTLCALSAWVGAYRAKDEPSVEDDGAGDSSTLHYENERRKAQPPFGLWMRARAVGQIGERTQTRTLMLHHGCGYVATGLSLAAAVQQRLARPEAKGVHRAADWVEPGSFLKHLESAGMQLVRTEA